MAHAETLRSLVARIHAAGGAPFAEEAPGSGLYSWRTRAGRWPLEVQVDRFALELRCYLSDELLCTGRIPEDEADALVEPAAGPGDPGAPGELAAFLDGVVSSDTRRFMTPPHADRHPDRRDEERHRAAIEPRPPRKIDLPA